MRLPRPKTKKGKFALFLLILIIASTVYYFFFRDQGEGFIADARDPHANTIAANTLNCGLSVPTDEGDFYISGAPQVEKNNLNTAKLDGEPIKIIGYVYEGEGKRTKIPNAKVEVWQPDSYGVFHPQNKGDAAKFDKNQLALRGTVAADEFGYFEFNTIYPGAPSDRARHIFIKASADGYETLTTQLVMSRSGDAVSTNTDQVALSLPNCNVMYFGAVEGAQTAAYDFHLVNSPVEQTASQ